MSDREVTIHDWQPRRALALALGMRADQTARLEHACRQQQRCRGHHIERRTLEPGEVVPGTTPKTQYLYRAVAQTRSAPRLLEEPSSKDVEDSDATIAERVRRRYGVEIVEVDDDEEGVSPGLPDRWTAFLAEHEIGEGDVLRLLAHVKTLTDRLDSIYLGSVRMPLEELGERVYLRDKGTTERLNVLEQRIADREGRISGLISDLWTIVAANPTVELVAALRGYYAGDR